MPWLISDSSTVVLCVQIWVFQCCSGFSDTRQQAQENLENYGKTLLSHEPTETTQLLIDLCCGTLWATASFDPSREDPVKGSTNAAASYLSYLPYGGKATAVTTPNVGPGLTSAPDSLDSRSQRKPGGVPDDVGTPDRLPPEEEPVSPRLFFAHFVDHPSHFITFLETVAARRWDQVLGSDQPPVDKSTGEETDALDENDMDRREQSAVWNTLLELYLSEASSSSSADGADSAAVLASRDVLESKALSLLRQRARLPYDSRQALIVCTTASFTPGIIELYEQLGMYDDIVRFWMDRSAGAQGTDSDGYSQKVVDALHRYGPERPHLYPMVLRYLSSSAGLLERHRDELVVILDHIDREKIMPPIQVVQALSRTGVTSIGLVKDYFKRQIVAERQEIDSVRLLLSSFLAPCHKG
jgi:hypothetical protein